MNSGKVSNTMLKRSVIKLISKRRNEVIQGSEIGIDCARLVSNSGSDIVTAVSNADYGVYRVSNNIAATGGRLMAVLCNVMMPNDFNEQELKQCMRNVENQCIALDAQVVGGHTSITADVIRPVTTVTGIGYADADIHISAKNVKAGQDIVMTKWIGIEGIRSICNKKSHEILKLYSQDLIDKAMGLESDMSIAKEAQIAASNGIIAMHDVAEGGIFGALWDMAEAGNVGLDVNFKKIAVKQEIIEICEIFDLNPYELLSSGCLLMTSEQGCDIVNELQASGIKAEIIGRTTDGNDRIIHNEDEIRYLDPPKRDEIYRI